jgi:hypothetical protein
MKLTLRIVAVALVLGRLGDRSLAQQSPVGGGNSAAAGTPRGIRAVTRRTLMSGYGTDASAFMTAGGLNGFATVPNGSATPQSRTVPVAAPSTASVAPVPIRPEIRRSLEQLARRGDPAAAAALAELARPASASLP